MRVLTQEWFFYIRQYYRVLIYFLLLSASTSSCGDKKEEGSLKQYHVEQRFADRRYKVTSARTYFYLNEASCEKNMEHFLKSIDAVHSELA